MAHECEDCGESFETLTRLRLHDCEDTTTPTPSDAAEPLTDDRNATVPELDDRLDRVAAGEVDAIFGAVATFESELSTALDEDEGGATYRDLFWAYYEPISDGIDEATRSRGWTLLEELLGAYDPTIDEPIPLATPAIANAVGRTVIRTRLTDGVEAIPAGALDYLAAVAVEAGEGDDVAREETHAYGWGIGHPDHAVVSRLHDRASADVFWVNAVLEHAFYADQHAAVDVLERLVRDESIDGTFSRPMRDDMPYRRFLLDCVYGLQADDHWPTTPRYWDWDEAFDHAFELDETVERRIRNLVAETGFDTDLPDDWELRDLGV
ncbi:MAG TPA: hypothetical protein VJ898_16315 [Natrialbaceae archaeon]|nr:hypothetical protein [Natrialbaceae archaeon]